MPVQHALLLFVVPTSWLFRPLPTKSTEKAGDGRRYACPMFCTMADVEGPCPVCGMSLVQRADDETPADTQAHSQSEGHHH